MRVGSVFDAANSLHSFERTRFMFRYYVGSHAPAHELALRTPLAAQGSRAVVSGHDAAERPRGREVEVEDGRTGRETSDLA